MPMRFTNFLSQRFKKYFFYIPVAFICISFLAGIGIGNVFICDSCLHLGILLILLLFFIKNKFLQLLLIYSTAFICGINLINWQSGNVPVNCQDLIGDATIYGYVKDVNYKNGRTNVILYDLKWEDSDRWYSNLIKLSKKGKINVLQDQKIRADVNLEIPENFDPEFDYVEYLSKKGIYLIGEAERLEVVGHKKSLVYYLGIFKNKIIESIRQIYNEPEASLLLGLVTGYRADFDEVFDEQLSKTGTTHIVAISGFNISLLITLLARLAPHISKWGSSLLALLVSILFCILTGACPSIVRATIMASVVLIGRELGRDTHPSILLLLTASIMAFFNPYILWDIGFQLSFLSTIGLVYLLPFFNLLFKDKGYLEPLFSTAGAFITTLPVIVSTFGQFSILVFISNLLVLSVVSLSTVLGLINTMIALISIKLGLLFSFINYLPLHYIVRVIETLAKSPVNVINVNFKIKPFQIFIYYLFLFIVILYKDFKSQLSESC